jgi:hypothetical protein
MKQKLIPSSINQYMVGFTHSLHMQSDLNPKKKVYPFSICAYPRAVVRIDRGYSFTGRCQGYCDYDVSVLNLHFQI